MKILFYITNHGYGHASRNVPIIEELLRRNNEIVIRSDVERIKFLRNNFKDLPIKYSTGVDEPGIILKSGKMTIDYKLTKERIVKYNLCWESMVENECRYLHSEKPDLVVVDMLAIAIDASNYANIPCIMISNFDWALVYSRYFDRDIWTPFLNAYKRATKILWYEIHSDELHNHNSSYELVSMVSRKVNQSEMKKIKLAHSKPIVFVSIGASAELNKQYDVSSLNYDFIVTRGINLIGDNVYELPPDMVNTYDYIAASDYIIAKGGWSTVAEILLQKKKCALLMRGDNPEDMITREVLESREHAVIIDGDSLIDINMLLNDIKSLRPKSYEYYVDEVDRICNILLGEVKNRF